MTTLNSKPSQEIIKPDIFELVKKYLHLIWRKKYWIILITLLVTILWIFVYNFYLETSADYITSAVIQFDDPRASRGYSPVTDFDYMTNLSKVAIVNSSTFLNKVVDSLNLNISIATPGIRRTQFFFNLRVDSLPNYGLYKFVKNKHDSLNVFYTKRSENISNELIYSTSFKDDSIAIFNKNGLYFEINPFYFKNVPEIDVRCRPNRIASEILKGRISTRLVRTQTLLTISYSDKDPHFSAEVTNTIAQIFIDMLYDQKRYQTSSVISSLKEQLNLAKAELALAEDNLRRFREQNPFIFLAQDGQSLVNEMSEYETNLRSTNQSLSDIKTLIEKNGGQNCLF